GEGKVAGLHLLAWAAAIATQEVGGERPGRGIGPIPVGNGDAWVRRGRLQVIFELQQEDAVPGEKGRTIVRPTGHEVWLRWIDVGGPRHHRVHVELDVII